MFFYSVLFQSLEVENESCYIINPIPKSETLPLDMALSLYYFLLPIVYTAKIIYKYLTYSICSLDYILVLNWGGSSIEFDISIFRQQVKWLSRTLSCISKFPLGIELF
jgi:hypothetical protein